MSIFSWKIRPKGFTLMELLVVISILGIFLSIGVVVSQQGRQRSRDNERKATLEQLRTALELYRDQHEGKYPVTGSAWYSSDPTDTVLSANPSNSGNWIPGLAPVYIAALPSDPKGGTSQYPGCGSAWHRSYIYNSPTGADYVLLSNCAPERPFTSSDPYFDCLRDGDYPNTDMKSCIGTSWAFKVCSPGGCTW